MDKLVFFVWKEVHSGAALNYRRNGVKHWRTPRNGFLFRQMEQEVIRAFLLCKSLALLIFVAQGILSYAKAPS